MSLPKKIIISESGMRDGLQNEKTILSAEEKIFLINELADAGLTDIEGGSFVRADRVPAMANSAEVFRGLDYDRGVKYYALIPNRKGLERAIEAGARLVGVGVSASAAHNLANYNRTPEESLAAYQGIIETAREHGLEIRSSIQMAFGSPWERVIPVDHLKRLVEKYKDQGVNTIIVADTAGVATPDQVYETMSGLSREFPGTQWLLHLHNTRGVAMCNLLAGMEAGVTMFAASVAGLGGCPFVPNAAGNLATEDVVHLMDEMKIETGINLDRLLETARRVERLVGHEGHSYILRAGKSCDLLSAVKRQGS